MASNCHDKFNWLCCGSRVKMHVVCDVIDSKGIDRYNKQSPRDDRDLETRVVRVGVKQFHDSLRLCWVFFG